jgi:hypothetical protein
VIRTLDTSPLVDREHFGFRDGVSQPRIEELGAAPGVHSVMAGEFVLGDRNGYGDLTPRPLLDPGSIGKGSSLGPTGHPHCATSAATAATWCCAS